MYEKYEPASRERCDGCHLLLHGNFKEGPQFCCSWFTPPKRLSNVECLHERYGFGVVVTPRVKTSKKEEK